MKKKTGTAMMHMLLGALGGTEGLANRFSAVPNSEQITPSPGQLGVGETKTRWMNCKQLSAHPFCLSNCHTYCSHGISPIGTTEYSDNFTL
jgi:hypothetical protein